ncbi:unnamed protein product [Orchesella dallaii]|uniref:Uncharacterized protein n=1 Tax=Orchesella dallaii TaxID=48710 RepID=A0ABP1S9F4_9HEXA
MLVYLLLKTAFRVPNNDIPVKNQYSKPHLRQWKTYIREYRSLEILNIQYLEFYSPFSVLMNATAVQVALFSNVMLFTKWEQLSTEAVVILVSWCALDQILWVICLEMAAQLSVEGERTVKAWKGFDWDSVVGNKVMKKFAKSCKPIRIGHGTMYTIRKRNVLTFFKAILRGTFRAFLTLQNKHGN